MIEPLRLSFEVNCSAEHAFATWTQRTRMWWPAAHTVSHEPDAEIVFDPRVGGRIYERTPAGQEIDWGEIKVWEPPRRLVYLWRIATDQASATEVEIGFIEHGEKTRVDIEHRGWERLGERGLSWREANQGGWDGVLPDYIAACAHVIVNAQGRTTHGR
ncbi:MAG: SRPBCC domain-containing protein [Chloroflexota bacterium]|nr:SRPBCC domain-containing protein [Chloroflexota bacterium]